MSGNPYVNKRTDRKKKKELTPHTVTFKLHGLRTTKDAEKCFQVMQREHSGTTFEDNIATFSLYEVPPLKAMSGIIKKRNANTPTKYEIFVSDYFFRSHHVAT